VSGGLSVIEIKRSFKNSKISPKIVESLCLKPGQGFREEKMHKRFSLIFLNFKL